MNGVLFKTSFCLTLMIMFLTMAFITNDAVKTHLFASCVIITGAFANKKISTDKTLTNERY